MNELTFGQSIGAEPLPSQAALGTISQETVAALWAFIREWFDEGIKSSSYGSVHFEERAGMVFKRWWVTSQHRMIDEIPDPDRCLLHLKSALQGGHVRAYNLVQFLLSDPGYNAKKALAVALERTRAAYRVVEGRVVPYTSEAEHKTIEAGFGDARSSAPGSFKHLSASAAELTRGNWGSSVHESISAVESAARKACGDDGLDLRRAVGLLRQEGKIPHAAIGEMFVKLYAYGSDEKGARHALGSSDLSNVGEGEAMMVFGVSAALVSYLVKATQKTS